jgi:hypothetical protein
MVSWFLCRLRCTLFKVKDVSSEKAKWVALIEEYAHFSNTEVVHWFFWENDKGTSEVLCL